MRDTIDAENYSYQLKGTKNAQTKQFQYLRQFFVNCPINWKQSEN